jgi:hypothetical protein
MAARVRAPELQGAGGWINTGGRSWSIADFRGRVLILDFWTFCCVNCLHVLDELRPLEARFAPVLDDPELATWSQYAVRAWPTLCVIDPEGYLVHVASGEGHGEGLARLVEQLVAEHSAKGTLQRRGAAYVPPPPAQTELRFPGKVALLPDGTLLVSDTAHHSVVRMAADGETVLRRYGTGERGFGDGRQPQLAEPQGVAVLASGEVLVADTANHVVRRLDLESGAMTTIAGTGRVWRPGDPTTGPALEVNLSTPWDLAEHDGEVVLAMAGTHQLWALRDGQLRVIAGTTGEGLRDGDALTAYLAQPSGLASDGERLWFADAETSALRWYLDGQVGTAIGTGLFDFGHRDGPASEALLQHPLGVAVLPDGSVAVCDTYNGAVRRYDPASGEVTTLARDVAEPSGAVVVDGELVVVASAAHRLERPVAPGAMAQVRGAQQSTRRPATDVAPGAVLLEVVFEPPPGQHLDERDGPATRLVVTASPPELLVSGGGASTGLRRELVLAQGVAEGVLHVAATAASCDEGVEHPACHITQQDWGIPVRLRPEAPGRLGLVLRGPAV